MAAALQVLAWVIIALLGGLCAFAFILGAKS